MGAFNQLTNGFEDNHQLKFVMTSLQVTNKRFFHFLTTHPTFTLDLWQPEGVCREL